MNTNSQISTLNESFRIAPAFLSYIQNITIEGSKDNYDLGWYEKGCECIEKLSAAKTVLKTLTLVVMPRRLRRAVTALGIQRNAITFSDFLWIRGRFMNAFKTLSCKEFRVVIKKHKVMNIPAITVNPIDTLNSAEVERKHVTVLSQGAEALIKTRFLISLDLTYLHGTQKIDILANKETIRLRQEKRAIVLKQIRQLRRKIENVFFDHNKAIESGICQMESEKIKVTYFSEWK